MWFEYLIASVSNYNPEPPEPPIQPLSIGIIGDSIARGTNETLSFQGAGGDADPGSLSEWLNGSLVEVTADVDQAYGGSVYPALANYIYANTNRPVHVINKGVGGAEFSFNGSNSNWSDTGNLYAPAVSDFNNYVSSNKSLDLIYIILGINDATGSADLTAIESDADDLISRLNTDFPNVPIMMHLCDKTTTNAKIQSIRQIITDIAAGNSLVSLGEDLTDYTEYMFDGTHLNQEGNNAFGEADAVDIINLLSIPTN